MANVTPTTKIGNRSMIAAVSATRRNQRLIFWVVTVLLVALLTFPYYGTMIFS